MDRMLVYFSFILFFWANSLFASNQYTDLDLSKQETQWLNKIPEIKIGIQSAWIPLSYMEAGKPRGLGVDYINLINSKLNGKIKIYADSFKNNLDKVKSGELDAMIDITPTKAREKSYYFTSIYVNIPHFIVSRKGDKEYYAHISDLNGKTVVVEKGYGIIKKLKEVVPNVKFKYFDNTINAIEALSSGTGDVYVGNRAVVNHIMRESFITNLKFDGKSDISRSILAIGVNKKEEILRDILQKALDNISLEQKQKIYKNYVGKTYNETRVNLTDKEKKYLQANPVVRVGGEKDWSPFDFVDANGKYSGISKDIFELAAQRAGLEINYVTGQNWQGLMDDFKNGKLDILPAIYKNKQREKFTIFTKPYFTVKDYAFVRNDDNSIHNINDLAKKRVAIIGGYAIEENLKKKFPYIKLLRVKNKAQGIDAVLLNKADVYIDGYAVMMYTLSSKFITGLKPVIPVDFYSNDLYIGITKNKPLLASIIKKALDTISIVEKNKILNKWLLQESRDDSSNKYSYTEKQWLKKHNSIRLAYMGYWPVDNNGKNIHMEYAALLSRYGDININLVKFDRWQDGFQAATKGESVQGILNLSWSKEREKNNFDYTKPYFFTPAYIVVKKDNNSIKNIEDLKDKPLFLKKDSITTQIVKQLKYNIHPIILNSDLAMLKALSKKGSIADAILTYSIDPELLDLYGLKVANKFYNRFGEVYIGVSKNQKEVFSILNKAYERIPKNKLSAIQNKIYKKKEKPYVQLSKKEKAFIKKHPVIRVHNETNWAPFNFYEFGSPKGYSIDLIKLIAKNTGLKIKFVTGPTWDQFLTMMKDKKLDVMLNIAKNKKREKYIVFTDPFINVFYSLAVRKNDSSIQGFDDIVQKNKTVALEKGFNYYDYLKENYPKVPLKVVDNGLETLQDVSNGKADAALGMVYTMNFIAQKNNIDNIRIFRDYSSNLSKMIPLRIGIRKDLPLLRSILEKGLASIKPEEFQRLSKRWLGQKEENVPQINLTKDEAKWLEKHKSIKVVNEIDWPPYDFDINGEASGYSIEYIKELAKIIGIKLDFVKGTWSELLKKFENKQIDLIHVFNKTPKREQKYLFSKPYMSPSFAITLRKDENAIKNIDDLKNKTVACGKDWESTKIFKKLYPDIKVVEFDNLSKMLKALSFGKVDAVLDDMASSYYNIIKDKFLNLRVAFEVDLSEKGKDNNWYLAVHKGDELLLSILNKAIKAVPRKTLEQLNSKWFGESKKLDLTKKEQKWMDKHQSIRYVYDINWAPFEWKNELGEHTGIIYDILSLISEKSGIKFQPISTNSWSEAVELMKNKKADMYSAIGENKQREKYLQFTKNTIFKTPYVFVARSDDKNDYLETFKVIENKKVAVVDGYTIEGLLEKEKPNIPLIKVKTVEEGFNKVRDGNIDIFIVNAVTAKYFIHRMGYDDLKIATKTEFSLNLKIALQKDFPKEAVSIIDKAVSTISQKELSDIYFKWTEAIVEKTINWKLIYQITGAALVLLLAIIYWNRKLKSLVDQKTNEIRLLLRSFDKNVIASKTDKKGIITYVSDKFCEMSGYSREELIGNTHAIIRHSETPKEIFVDLWKTLKADKVWNGEIKNRKKDGSFFWVYAIISPECDPSGEPCGFSAIMQDISAKKEVEELSATLEQKVIERTSELNDEREFIQAIMNSQTNIVISSDGQYLRTANKAFLDFYKVKSIDEFMKKFGDCICDTFDTKENNEFVHKQMNGENWIDYIYSRADQIHKVKIVRDLKEYIFTLTADKFTFDGKELKTVVFTDITELEKIREQIETILSNILLPILITSRKSRTILYANKHAQIQYEKPLDQIVGKSIDEVYTMQGQQNHILEAIQRDGKIENSEEVFKTFTGKEFTALLSVTPIKYQGEDALIGMVTDITKQKIIEAELKEAHAHTKSSIEYASLIQHAIIPKNTHYHKYFKDYFTIWEPKDIVGGDIYLFNELRNDDECLMMVIDCTGHGVPGAFVTMLVKAIERQVAAIIENDPFKEVDTAWILEYFNKTMKYLLDQEDETSISNAGFDAAVLYYNKLQNIVKFAGAELPLFYIQNGEYKMIKGDRQSIGYKKSDMDFKFKEHSIHIDGKMSFYMTTDGYLDQNGGEKGFPYGKKRFKTLLEKNFDKPFMEQKTNIMQSLLQYQDKEERNDDVTVIGMKIVEQRG